MSTPSVTPRGGVAAALAVVYITWGSTFVAMRVAVRSLPPLTMSGVRFLAAGLLLYGWCRWQRHRHPEAGWRAPTRREWRASAILGIALPAAGTGGAAWAEQKIPAGTAALLLATVPVWMIITSRIVDNERIRFLTAGGLVLGLAGVAVLINPLAGAAPDLFASAVALGGALCWGCGSVYAKRAPHPGQPLLASGMEMICAGVVLGLIGAAGGELGRISAASLVSASGLALGYLIVFGSLLGYSTYEWLLHHASSQLASTYAFVCPLVAVILGWWLLGEQISGRTLLAAAAISVGVALIMLHPREPEPGRDETGDQPRKPPAARVPATNRHQRKHPAGDATSGINVKLGRPLRQEIPVPPSSPPPTPRRPASQRTSRQPGDPHRRCNAPQRPSRPALTPLESSAFRQMHGLPEQAFDMLVTLLARICDDPYDPVFSAPTGVPRRRVADLGGFGFAVFAVDEAAGLIRVFDLVWTG